MLVKLIAAFIMMIPFMVNAYDKSQLEKIKNKKKFKLI